MIGGLISSLLSGARVVVVPKPVSGPVLNPAEEELARSLVEITGRYGKLFNGGMIYGGYEAGALNEDQNKGVMCKNCVMFQGGGRCKIFATPVEETGKCRFAIIPDGVVR